jgi:transposase-like protein
MIDIETLVVVICAKISVVCSLAVNWYQGYITPAWRVAETDIKVCGEWLYLFKPIDSGGRAYLQQSP